MSIIQPDQLRHERRGRNSRFFFETAAKSSSLKTDSTNPRVPTPRGGRQDGSAHRRRLSRVGWA